MYRPRLKMLQFKKYYIWKKDFELMQICQNYPPKIFSILGAENYKSAWFALFSSCKN